MKKSNVLKVVVCLAAMIFGCIFMAENGADIAKAAEYEDIKPVAINSSTFPDPNFRAYVSGEFDRDKDGTLSRDEIVYARNIWADGNQNIIIKPLSRDVVESGVLDECCLLNLEIHKSFARISSALLLKQISEVLNLNLSKSPTRFETTWDSVENILIVNVKGGQK